MRQGRVLGALGTPARRCSRNAAKSERPRGARGLLIPRGMRLPLPPVVAPVLVPPSSPGYHGAVSDFKRRLIEATLHQMRGNRTHTARVLGLQRTYLLRLIRELGVAAPPPPPRRRHGVEPTLTPARPR